MSSSLFVFFILLLPMGANCHFLHHQVKRRTTATPNNNLQTSSQSIIYNKIPRRHLSIPVAFLSIRGGSGEDPENSNEEVDDNFSADFVSSFESELMEIRQEAELEAEAELEKLRLMLREQGVVVNDEEGSDQGSSSEVDDDEKSAQETDDNTGDTVESEEEVNSTNNEQYDREDESSAVEEAEESSAVEETETSDLSHDDERISNDVDEEVADSETADEESGDEQENDGEVVLSDDDESSAITETASAVDDSDGKKRDKPKKSKAKKSKSSKQTSKSNKSSSSWQLSDIESLSEEEVGTVESVVLTRTIEREVESQPRGVSGFIKSDLFRALSLLIATIIVSVMMQRLQRQMEAQGL